MFKINDYVVYGLTGICEIVDIRKDNHDNSDGTEYYVLKPVYGDNMIIMVPVNNPHVVMRTILTKEDVLSLIDRIPNIETTVWIDNDMQRKNNFKAAIRTGKTEEWVKIIKTLYQEKAARAIRGRKLAKIDEDMLNTAEKYLNQEVALVLNISPDEVVPYIMEHIS